MVKSVKHRCDSAVPCELFGKLLKGREPGNEAMESF